MRTTPTSVCVWLVCGLVGGTAAVEAQEAAPEVRPIVDGASFLRRPAAPAAARLVAPDLVAARTELPATAMPPGKIEAARRRASDIDGNGIVDSADLAALIDAIAARDDRADLDGDGTTGPADVAVLLERLGQVPGGAADARYDKLEVGSVLPAPPGLVDGLPQHERPDGGWVRKLELRSPQAQGLRVQLAGLTRRSGVELRVYDPAGTAVLGPYTGPRLSQDGTWWSPTIFGDTIGLEFTRQPGSSGPTSLPGIVAVAYIYGCDCHNGPGTPLGCHNDVTCDGPWATNEALAVGAMGFNSGGGCFVCTGALLNRTPDDAAPLFMTANHCISTQAEADSLEILWLYQTSVCNGSAPNFNNAPRTNGALIVKRHSGSDWTLLGLWEPPLANYYLGSDANGWFPLDDATGIHHPAGSFKRISYGSTPLFHVANNVEFCDSNGQNCFTADEWVVDYDDGTTEGGSSGSPIFDGEARVRGALSGGESGCAPLIKYYGRLDLAYTNVRYYLYTVPTPLVYVDGSVGGDSGNNGSSERGSSTSPFNTVYEATFCVVEGDEVRIDPGSYDEQFTLLRPMTLTRWGASGTVRIGGAREQTVNRP